MARGTLTAQTLTRASKINTVTFAAAVAADDTSFANDGRQLLLCKCTDSAAHTVTVVSVADPFGRTGDITITVPATVSTDDGVSIAGPFPPELFNQSTGLVHVDLSDATGLTFAVITVSPAIK